MMQIAVPDTHSLAVRAYAPPAARRPVLAMRSARVLVQAGCLGVVVLAPLSSVPGLPALVAAQVLAGLLISFVLKATMAPGAARTRTARTWGVGMVCSLVVVSVLHGLFHMDVGRAQLGAVVALIGLGVLGHMRDAYAAAGTQLDAILATLPPPQGAQRP